jgi:VWFA-related protein
MRLTCAFAAACVVSAGLAGAARQATPPSRSSTQQPAQAPVFKSNIVIARLDITAFDKHGKPVTDLNQNDFSVFENGVRQDVRTFSREQFTPEAPSPNAGPTLVRGLPFDPVAPRTRRVFLIVLGYGRLQGPAKAFDGTITFIRDRLLPQDLVSVMAFNRATDLTTNHEQVAEVVERLKTRHEHLVFETDEYFIDPAHKAEDIPASIQADIDAVFQPPGTPDQHTRSATSMLLGTDMFRRNDDVPWLRPWNKRVTGMDLLKVYAGIEYLRYLDGEKHLVCLTFGDDFLDKMQIADASANRLSGASMQDTDDDHRLAARANDARVALDLIHTGGVSRGIQAFVIGSSENLAEFTGGQFTGVSYADAALGRIDQATRFGYVLGYTPSNPALDDKYRNVTVKVNRPGVTTLFRHGYTAQADVSALDLRQILTSVRLHSAEKSDLEEHDIKLQAKASLVSAAGPVRQIRVDLTIDVSRLSLTKAGTRRVGTIDVDIFCGDVKQKMVGSLKQRLDLSLEGDAHQRLLKTGVPYTATVPITATAAYVKVLVYDYGADLLGTAVVSVK